MKHIIIIYLVLYVAIYVNSNHFNGGFMTAYPKSSNETHVTMILVTRFSYTRTALNAPSSFVYCDDSIIKANTLIGPSFPIKCKVGCNVLNEAIGNTEIECTSFSTLNDWTMGENRFEFTVPKTANYEASYTGQAWRVLSISSSTLFDWEIRLKINTQDRLDTNSINHSPYTFVPPIIQLKLGTIFTLKMPKYDANGDITKCRWSTSANGECASICQTVPFATLDSINCTLTFDLRNATTSNLGWYGAALQIEDFYNNLDTTPISSTPLQFLIQVTGSSSSCQKIPTLPPDSCLAITSGTVINFNVTAQTNCQNVNITEMIVTGPYGLDFTHPVQYPGISNQSYSTIYWNSTESSANVTMVCTIAVDSNELSSIVSCVTVLIDMIFPSPKPQTKSPTGTLQVKFMGSNIRFHIDFNIAIARPNFKTYINIYYSDGKKLTSYDCSDLTNVSYTSYGISFKLPTSNLRRTKYYITFDEGVGVVYNILRTGCDLKSYPITLNTYWEFRITKPIETICNLPTFMFLLCFYWFMFLNLHIFSIVIAVSMILRRYQTISKIIFKFNIFSRFKRRSSISATNVHYY